MNLDDDLLRFPESVADSRYYIQTYFRKVNGLESFCIGHDLDKNCYTKVR
ncbi:hypothetical protein [Nibribacter koreensis]